MPPRPLVCDAAIRREECGGAGAAESGCGEEGRRARGRRAPPPPQHHPPPPILPAAPALPPRPRRPPRALSRGAPTPRRLSASACASPLLQRSAGVCRAPRAREAAAEARSARVCERELTQARGQAGAEELVQRAPKVMLWSEDEDEDEQRGDGRAGVDAVVHDLVHAFPQDPTAARVGMRDL